MSDASDLAENNEHSQVNNTSVKPFTPIVSAQRIDALDILRGIALLGIIFMNIEWFGRPIGELGTFNHELSGFDHAIAWLVRCFVEGKFYKLFALLFGMGFAVMLNRAIEAEKPFGAWFIRRMLVLLLFGMLHLIFLWEGDILHDYAISGLILLGWVYLLRTKRFSKFNTPQAMLNLGLWWLMVPPIIMMFVGVGYNTAFDRIDISKYWQESQQVQLLYEDLKEQAKLEALEPPENKADQLESTEVEDLAQSNDEIAEQEELSPEQQAQVKFEKYQDAQTLLAEEEAALVNGTYWDAVTYRAKKAPGYLGFSFVFAMAMLVPIFILGFWLVSSGIMKNHQQHRRLFSLMAKIGLGTGLIMTVGGLTLSSHPAVENIMSLQGVGGFMFVSGQFLMSAGYLGLIMTLLQSQKWQRLLGHFSAFGRMALTNYIAHSLILSTLFYGYGFGLYEVFSRTMQIPVVLLIVIIQIPLSKLWLNNFQFGPLEWLWRCLSYMQWQPFRKEAIV